MQALSHSSPESASAQAPKKRPGLLVRSMTGLFTAKSQSAKTTAARQIRLERTPTFAKRRPIFKRHVKQIAKPRDGRLLSLESLPTTRGWSEPPPEYTLLNNKEEPHAPWTNGNPANTRQDSSPGSPLAEFNIRYVDEVEARQLEQEEAQNGESFQQHDISDAIPEVTPSLEDNDAEEGVTEMKQRDSDRFPALTKVLRAAGHKSNPTETFSDGPCDLAHPTPLRRSFLSFGNAGLSPNPLIRAIYQENAQHLEQARITRFDGDYAYALHLQTQDELAREKRPVSPIPVQQNRCIVEDLQNTMEDTLTSFKKTCRVCCEYLNLSEFPSSNPVRRSAIE